MLRTFKTLPPLLCTVRINRRLTNSTIPARAKQIKKKLLEIYKQDVEAGKLEYDPSQYQVLRYLSRLCDHLNDSRYVPVSLSTGTLDTQTKTCFALASDVAGSSSQKVVHFTGPYARETVSISTSTAAATSVGSSTSTLQLSPSGAAPAAADITPTLPTAADIDQAALVRGVYVHGQVGTGKTLLMDSFFDACSAPHIVNRKRRVHFHQFMLEIHRRIRKFKLDLIEKHGRSIQVTLQSDIPSERDAITQIALQVSHEAWLLCFDEFQVTDVADALILHRFFDVLWSQGTVLVATSNRAPQELYQNGINRSYFLPFLTRLEQQCVIQDINSVVDYRSLVQHTEDCYVVIPTSTCKSTSTTTSVLWKKFLALGNDNTSYSMTTDTDDADTDMVMGMGMDKYSNKHDLHIETNTSKSPCAIVVSVMMGRSLIADKSFPKLPGAGAEAAQGSRLSLRNTERVFGEWPTELPIASHNNNNDNNISSSSGSSRGIGWFTFAFLCEKERSAADYQALCDQFDTIFIDNIPTLSVLEHDKARRFIILVDTLYDNNTRLYWAAHEIPEKLFLSLKETDLSDVGDGGRDGNGNGLMGAREQSVLSSGSGLFGTDHKWVQPNTQRSASSSTSSDISATAAGSDQRSATLRVILNSSSGSGSHAEEMEIYKSSQRQQKQESKKIGNNSSSRVSQSTSCIYPYHAENVLLKSHSVTATATATDNNNDDDTEHPEVELKLLEGELSSVQELSMAFKRAASRLTEMAGADYHARWAGYERGSSNSNSNKNSDTKNSDV